MPTAIATALPAQEAFHCIKDYFETAPLALITKERAGKYCVTADIFVEMGHNLLQCTMKAQVFRVLRASVGEQLVVVTCRRAGDGVAFAGVLLGLRQHLQGAASTPTLCHAAPESPWAPVLPEDLLPLVDMLAVDAPRSRAEAVAGLLACASSCEDAAAMVCTAATGIHTTLASLLKELSDHRNTPELFPVACLAYKVAKHCTSATAENLFRSSLQAAAATSDRRVLVQLTKTLQIVSTFCSVEGDKPPKRELRGLLEGALEQLLPGRTSKGNCPFKVLQSLVQQVSSDSACQSQVEHPCVSPTVEGPSP